MYDEMSLESICRGSRTALLEDDPRLLHCMRHQLPIIVTSEWAFSDDMAFAEAGGGNAFLKPFSARQFQDCVDSLLDPYPSCAGPKHELERLASRALARSAFAHGNVRVTLAV